MKKLFIGLVILISCIMFTMVGNAAESSDLNTMEGKYLASQHGVMKVFENGRDIIVWVDTDRDGVCNGVLVYVFQGIETTTGTAIYAFLKGSCEDGDALMLKILNNKAKKEKGMYI